MKYFIFLFLLITFSALGFLYLINAGFYPVAIVNSKVVWGYYLKKETKAANYYFQQVLSRAKDQEVLGQINLAELQKAALENIIEKIVIAQRLKKEMGETELNASVKDLLKKHLEKPELEPAASLLYGLSFEDFYNMVLLPQAEREILESRLKEKGIDFYDWLEKEKQSANVVYITQEF